MMINEFSIVNIQFEFERKICQKFLIALEYDRVLMEENSKTHIGSYIDNDDFSRREIHALILLLRKEVQRADLFRGLFINLYDAISGKNEGDHKELIACLEKEMKWVNHIVVGIAGWSSPHIAFDIAVSVMLSINGDSVLRKIRAWIAVYGTASQSKTFEEKVVQPISILNKAVSNFCYEKGRFPFVKEGELFDLSYYLYVLVTSILSPNPGHSNSPKGMELTEGKGSKHHGRPRVIDTKEFLRKYGREIFISVDRSQRGKLRKLQWALAIIIHMGKKPKGDLDIPEIGTVAGIIRMPSKFHGLR